MKVTSVKRLIFSITTTYGAASIVGRVTDTGTNPFRDDVTFVTQPVDRKPRYRSVRLGCIALISLEFETYQRERKRRTSKKVAD